MGKIIVFAVSGDEEQILFRMQKYLQSKENCMLISESENKKLSFPDLEIDLYLREIRQQKRVIKLTDLGSYCIWQNSRDAYLHTVRFMKRYGEKSTPTKKETSCPIYAISGKRLNRTARNPVILKI